MRLLQPETWPSKLQTWDRKYGPQPVPTRPGRLSFGWDLHLPKTRSDRCQADRASHRHPPITTVALFRKFTARCLGAPRHQACILNRTNKGRGKTMSHNFAMLKKARMLATAFA